MRSGEALGALVLPRGRRRPAARDARPAAAAAADGRGLLQRRGPAEAALRRVERSSSRWPRPTTRSRTPCCARSAELPRLIVRGGDGRLPLGRRQSTSSACAARSAIIDGARRTLPKDARERAALEQVSRFARLAADNLDVSKPILASIGSPVQRQADGRRRRRTPLDTFAVAVAVTVSLMFVTLLLAAGHARARARGARVRRGSCAGWSPARALLAEKVGLAALCAFAVAAGDARAGSARSSALDWARFAAVARRAGRRRAGLRRAWAWRSAALAREVRAASLLAFMLVAAARVPRARARPARSAPALYDVDPRHLGAVPVQAGAGRARRRDQRRLAAARRAARCTWPALARSRFCAAARSPARGAGGVLQDELPSTAMAFPATRLRRLRATAVLRGLVRETELAVAHLVYPMFVVARRRRAATPIADDARHRPPLDRRRGRGGRRGRGARHPGGAAVRAAGRQGRAGLRRVGRRGRHPARHARDQGRAPRPAGDHRPVPVRVHEPRPLRRAARRRRRRQRRDARAARPHRGLPGRGRRRRRRAQRHDGRPRRRAARRARRARPVRDADHRLQRQVRLRLLRPVPRGGRLRARSRATAAATRWIPPTRARRVREAQLDADEGADIVMVKPALPVPRRDPPRQATRPACRSPPTTSAASTP